MSKSTLDAIVTADQQPPPDLPRLIVADTFKEHGRIMKQLELAVKAHQAIPDCTDHRQVDEHLKSIIKSCGHVITSANRLLEANR